MDTKMRGLNCAQIEVDEIWGFIGAKRNRADAVGAYGDVWTFIALDADTKLIPAFIVGNPIYLKKCSPPIPLKSGSWRGPFIIASLTATARSFW
jgi:hypothetical protein